MYSCLPVIDTATPAETAALLCQSLPTGACPSAAEMKSILDILSYIYIY